ncbi:MAG: LemA family protein [Thermodesulfobacteriota bacterium]
MTTLMILLAVVLALAVWAVAMYNSLVRNNNLVAEGFSGVDVQLTRRAELIPNLIETVKGYMTHERELLEAIAKLHAQSLSASDAGDRLKTEGLLGQALGKVLALAEAYPELKASTNFLELQKALSDIESELQLARRYYNGAVRNLNIAVESFPSNIIARTFGFAKAEFFEAEDEGKRQVPKVDFGNRA